MSSFACVFIFCVEEKAGAMSDLPGVFGEIEDGTKSVGSE
jgi:hypothetical protein